MPATKSAAQTCPKCGIVLQDAHCPNCDGEMGMPRHEVAEALRPYMLTSAAGFIGLSTVIFWAYPLLDGTSFFLVGLALFCVPSFFFYPRYGFRRYSSTSDLSGAKKVLVRTGIAGWCLLTIVVCNGALDRSFTSTQAVVEARQFKVSRRFSIKQYSLVVESWRPGRETETLTVDAATYGLAVPNQVVTVDVHQGFFGWPWYSSVQVRSFRGRLGVPSEE
jgi:hypothetical protein